MISRVAGAQITVIFWLVVRMARRERAQSDGGQQAAANRFQHRFPVRGIENGMRQRNSEDLVWATCGIIAVLAVDHIVKISFLGAPEALVETFAHAIRRS